MEVEIGQKTAEIEALRQQLTLVEERQTIHTDTMQKTMQVRSACISDDLNNSGLVWCVARCCYHRHCRHGPETPSPFFSCNSAQKPSQTKNKIGLILQFTSNTTTNSQMGCVANGCGVFSSGCKKRSSSPAKRTRFRLFSRNCCKHTRFG